MDSRELAAALGFAPDVLTDSVTSLRRALNDEGQPAQWIQVIAGRGYRFIGNIALRTPPPRSSWPASGQERAHFDGRDGPPGLLVRACAVRPTIVLVAGGAVSILSPENRARVAAAPGPVTMQVFTTPG